MFRCCAARKTVSFTWREEVAATTRKTPFKSEGSNSLSSQTIAPLCAHSAAAVLARGAITRTEAPAVKRLPILGSPFAPAPTTRQERFSSFRNIGNKVIALACISPAHLAADGVTKSHALPTLLSSPQPHAAPSRAKGLARPQPKIFLPGTRVSLRHYAGQRSGADFPPGSAHPNSGAKGARWRPVLRWPGSDSRSGEPQTGAVPQRRRRRSNMHPARAHLP